MTSIDRVTSATTSTWNTHVQKTIKLSQDLSRDLAKGVVGSSDSTKAFEGALQDLEHNFESTVAALRDQHEAEKQLVRTNSQDDLRASPGCVQESRQSFLEQKVSLLCRTTTRFLLRTSLLTIMIFRFSSRSRQRR